MVEILPLIPAYCWTGRKGDVGDQPVCGVDVQLLRYLRGGVIIKKRENFGLFPK